MRFLNLIPALFLANCVTAAPAPYIVTSYVEISVYTDAYVYEEDATSVRLETFTEAVVPKVTPVTNAITTITDTSEYAHVTILEVVLPPGAGSSPTPTYNYDDDASSSLYTEYVVPITYTPLASCTGTAQTWTYVTNVPVTLPSIIQPLVTPAAITTSASTTVYADDRIYAYTNVQAILNPTDIGSDVLASISSVYEPDYMTYCYTPTTTCTTVLATSTCYPTFAYASNQYYSSATSDYYCDDYYCGNRSLLIIVIAVPVGWVVLWLCLGLLESWFSFKGIMLGKNRKRGVPYAWCCISFFFLCCTGPTYKARSAEEQERLAGEWKEMGVGKKLKLWMKWGFRWKYPDMLGEQPEINKRAFREGCL